MNYDEIRKKLLEEFEAAKNLNMGDVANGTFQIFTLQTVQEMEKRRLDCLKQAEQLRMQAHAAESQAHAFSIVGSVMTSIVHGFIVNEQRRIDAEIIRKKEAEEAAALEAQSAGEPPPQTSDDTSLQEVGDKPKKRAAKKQ